MEISTEDLPRAKNEKPYNPVLLLQYLSEGNWVSMKTRYLHMYNYCGATLIDQDIGIRWGWSTDEWIRKFCYLYRGILFNNKNEIVLFAEKYIQM